MAIMKDNALGQGNMSRYLKYPGLAPTLLVLFNPPCIACVEDANGTSRWGRDDVGTVGHSLIYVQTPLVFRAVLVLLVYQFVSGYNSGGQLNVSEAKMNFFFLFYFIFFFFPKLPHKSDI